MYDNNDDERFMRYVVYINNSKLWWRWMIPIYVTVLGIETEVIDVHDWKVFQSYDDSVNNIIRISICCNYNENNTNSLNTVWNSNRCKLTAVIKCKITDWCNSSRDCYCFY